MAFINVIGEAVVVEMNRDTKEKVIFINVRKNNLRKKNRKKHLSISPDFLDPNISVY